MRVTGTPRAMAVVEQMGRVRGGTLTITIGTGCCESTAPFLYEDFWPGPDQAVVGEVAGVAVYAPEYLRTLYPDSDGMVVDVMDDVSAESLSIETEFDCRLVLRGDGFDFGADVAACDAQTAPTRPATISPTIATGGPSRVVGEMPAALRKMRMR